MAIQRKTFSAGDLAYQSWSKSYAIDLIITEESTSVDGNTSEVSYRLQLRSGGNNRFSNWPIDYAVTINGSVVSSGRPRVNQPYNHTTVLASGTVTVPHESDGSKNLSVKAYINCQDVRPYLPPYIGIDELFRLTTIPRTSKVSCTDGYIGGTGSLTIQSASSQFVHTLMCKFGELIYWVGSDGNWHDGPEYLSGGTMPFVFIDSMYKQIPNAKSGSGFVRCTTYLASDLETEIGATYADFTALTLESRCAPTIRGAVEDANPKTIALTGNKNTLVRYYSKALCRAELTTKNAATIHMAQVNRNSLVSGPVSIPDVEDSAFHFYIRDSRGYQGYDTVTPHVIPYIKLTNNAEAWRTEPTSGNVTIRFSGDYFNGSFGAKPNHLSLWYKGPGDAEPVPVTPVISGNTYTAEVQLSGFDYQRAYSITVTVSDLLVTHKDTLTIRKGIPVFDWGEDHFRVNVPLLGQHMEARGDCKNADEIIASGVYRIGEYSSNVPIDYGVLLAFNIARDNGYGAVLQIAVNANNTKRVTRMNWYGKISIWHEF